jgi:hypothetical protein
LLCAVISRIMIGVQIKNGFLDFAKTDFKCPHCEKEYSDADDKYLKRCEKNKNWTTKINCKCGKPFFMTYDYKGDAVSFV